jgi:hypothetical protein
MTSKIYEKGTIKVVWLEKDPLKIYSRMFEDERSAVKFGKVKKDYVIYKLLEQKNMKDFSWELLPYGKYKVYKLLFRVYRLLG